MSTQEIKSSIDRMKAQADRYKNNLISFHANLNKLTTGLTEFEKEIQETADRFHSLTDPGRNTPVIRMVSENLNSIAV